MCNSHPLLNVIFVAFATPFFFVSCDNSFFDWVDEKGNILISYDTQRQYDDYIQSNLISTEVPYSSWTHETFICFNKPITDCFRQTLTNEDLTDGDQQQNMMTHFSEDGENEDKQQKKDAKQPENDKIKKDGRNENEKDVKKEDTKIHHLIIDSFTLKNSTDLNNIFTKDLRLLLLLMDEKLNIRNLFELFKNAKHLKTLFFFTNTTESVIEVSDSDDLSDFNKMESSLDYLYLCGTFNPSAALLIALLEPKFLSTKYLESEYDFAEFEHLGKFEEVELRGRNLRNSSSVFDFLHSHNVKKLGLAKSELKDIPSELKQLESSLQYLSLASNDLSSIDSASIFPQVTALLELDLRFCQLKSLSSHFFDEVPSLRSVSLSGNYLLQSSQQNNLNFLKNNILYLDLNLNPFSHVISVKYTSSELRQFLNPKPKGVFLDLSYTYFKRCKSDSKYIQPNITHLSIIDSVNCFKNVNFTNLELLEAIDASSNINAKKSSPIIGDEIDSFFKRITNVRVLLFRENHLQRGLVVKPNLFEKRFTSLEILDLSENNLRTIPLNLFQIHTLKNLNLSSNLIQKWDVTLVRNDSSAKHLIVDLSFNKIAWITPAMEHDFYNFKEINLRDNVLLCNEQLKRLLCAAERNYGSVKILNMKETTCNRLDRDESLTLEELKKRENCQRATTASLSSDTRMGPMVPIQSLWLLLTVLVCLLLYATWNWTNHVNFYTISKNLKFAASLTTFSKKKESFCCDFRYDVFVSYAGIDRDWVIDRLMPNLETESGIRICLHERDFQIGVGIMENIVDCIDKSQCLLLVISKSFVKSKWCQFEMNLGQYFTIESNKPHLILVLLEEIPKNVRPKVLSYLMRTRTYIEWPKSAQENNEAEFFQRLTKALNDSRVS